MKKFYIFALSIIGIMFALFGLKTARDLQPVPATLLFGDSGVRKPQLVDRIGNPLSISYQNRWSVQTVPLREIPALLENAFIESEDRRFPSHNGVDWRARVHALAQNLRAMKGIRGASTITEQVVRMLHPRPRTVWSRWLEGIEAARLEKRFSKSEILEFYLNQVPYGHQRRGVVEAARFYFDRDPATLNVKESLALAILVRAPSGLDPRRGRRSIERRLSKLAAHMRDKALLSEAEYRSALSEGFEFAHSKRVIEAPQFVHYVFDTAGAEVLNSNGTVTTSLDGRVQQKVRQILWNRLQALGSSDVGDGAALVVDNRTGEVLAWVSESISAGESQGWVDAVTVRRQPGSTLKPFLYALAMEMGWTAATLIEDSPLSEAAGSGLHSFHNYSRTYYGPLRLRVALGNSLNTPAVRTIQFTGTERFLQWLRSLGISGLNRSADFYGHGLALGDGEVSLFELVQAYSALARHGAFRPLRTLSERRLPSDEIRPVIGASTAAIIADILSDPQARRLEFGEGHLLRFPVQTAVKTGTSSDHRDCWAVGFTEGYTAGVWMGNLDHRPTRGVTGAIGPALVLRGIFAELNRDAETAPFPSCSGLQSVSICAVSGMLAGPDCPRMDEKFEPGKVPVELCSLHSIQAANIDVGPESVPASPASSIISSSLTPAPGLEIAGPGLAGSRHPVSGIQLLQPTPGLQIAMDPRIPAELQAFAFRISKNIKPARVQWVLNGKPAGETGKDEHQFLWPLSRGEYIVRARVWRGGESEPVETPEVAFVVK
ncbi:MAG: transglycosylase domain-containing protein [Syntrophobacteraceae bacterium]